MLRQLRWGKVRFDVVMYGKAAQVRYGAVGWGRVC